MNTKYLEIQSYEERKEYLSSSGQIELVALYAFLKHAFDSLPEIIDSDDPVVVAYTHFLDSVMELSQSPEHHKKFKPIQLLVLEVMLNELSVEDNEHLNDTIKYMKAAHDDGVPVEHLRDAWVNYRARDLVSESPKTNHAIMLNDRMKQLINRIDETFNTEAHVESYRMHSSDIFMETDEWECDCIYMRIVCPNQLYFESVIKLSVFDEPESLDEFVISSINETNDLLDQVIDLL